MAINIKAPNLPMAKPVYNHSDQDYYSNVLRLYFNRLDAGFSALTGHAGAANINTPCALYYSTTQQTAAVINTAYPISFENTYFENGMTINGGANSEITVEKAGIYNFQFTGILESTSASQKEAWIWIRRDGTDIGYSGIPLTNALNSANMPIHWNFNIDVNEGGYIEIIWATNDTNLYFDSEVASAPYPGHSSAVMAVNYISNLDGFSIATAP